jgi:F0F1-type ATP synthase membrane subunit c/vacuolar-type H+-ATPase subunit K
MTKNKKHFFILFLLLFLSFILPVSPLFAQTPTSSATGLEGAATLGVAHIVEMQDKNIKDGSIVSSGKNGAAPTVVPYDSQVLGVVSRDAAIILDDAKSDKNGVPVISTGAVYILISSKDGNIKKGDLLATTNVPGVASKAVKDGFVLGTAMEDYSSSDPKKIDKIAVNLDLHYFNSKPTFPGTLSDIFKLVLLPTKDGPNPIFKYVMAAIVVLGSMILGFMSFGRAAAKGVEALGRNPAASRIIHLGIIFNVAIVVAIALAGLGVAFLILRL